MKSVCIINEIEGDFMRKTQNHDHDISLEKTVEYIGMKPGTFCGWVNSGKSAGNDE